MENILTPEQVKDKYSSQEKGINSKLRYDIVIKGLPSEPYTDGERWYMGMFFNIGDIKCFLTKESLNEAGYSILKVPLLTGIIKNLNEKSKQLKVKGKYIPDLNSLVIDYEGTIPYVEEVLDEIINEENIGAFLNNRFI